MMSGSHLEPLHRHIPDSRPNSNFGYREIVDYDMSNAETVEPGDVPVFDSHAMHQSTDNLSTHHRAAIVYHYSRAGTIDPSGSELYGWIPARRDGAAVPSTTRSEW
jgi:ectoine hydroxylase-related dioxygenase (phytanoyl-CoA dioxygenase family)